MHVLCSHTSCRRGSSQVVRPTLLEEAGPKSSDVGPKSKVVLNLKPGQPSVQTGSAVKAVLTVFPLSFSLSESLSSRYMILQDRTEGETSPRHATPRRRRRSSYVYVGSQMRRSLSVFTVPLQESCSSRWT